MIHRHLWRVAGATALGLLLTTAGAGPAAAEPADSAPGTGTALSTTPALQRDLGLPADRVEGRLDDETASAAVPGWRERLGASYAGAWLQDGVLVVATTDPAETTAIEASGARARVAERPEGDLDEVQAKLDGAAATVAEAVGSWYVDPVSNSVVVTTTDRAAAESFVSTAGAGADPVRIETVTDVPQLYADLVGGEAILAAAGGRCSIGFSAVSVSTTDAFVLTAGHCTELGGQWNGENGAVIGPVVESDFPGDDFGAIRVDNTAAWTPSAEVDGSIPVTGAQEAAIGAAVCRSGSTTGFRCGTITSRNATVNYGSGDIVRGLTGTTACAEPGDSGGSFVSGSQAQGMASGGSGNCRVGGQTFFQPVAEALGAYGLTLVTA